MRQVGRNRIEFLNTYLDNLTAVEAKAAVDDLIQAGGIHYVVTPNTDTIVKIEKDPELGRICAAADLLLTDGQMLVKLSAQLGTPLKERVCMTDFVWDVLDLAIERDYGVFFLGGIAEKLEAAREKIAHKYPTLRVAGSYSPPLGFEEDETELDRVNGMISRAAPDILIVFLGCPKQEKFIYHNKDKYRVPVSITMGGCVDFIAGSVKRAPLWMQRAGLEWLYRFVQEPRRLFRRYFIDDVRIFKMMHDYRKESEE